MAYLPLVHELGTSFASLGDVIVGNSENASKRWERYMSESVLGSSVRAAVLAASGDYDTATEVAKGAGRATGKAITLAGIGGKIPVLHELSVAGESLGDLIGGGDVESAGKRWVAYKEDSVVGSSVAAAMAAVGEGNLDEASRLGGKAGKSLGQALITTAAIGASVMSAGLAAPLGVGAAAVIAGATTAASSAGATVADAMIDGREIDKGAVVGGALLGSVAGAFAGATSARSIIKYDEITRKAATASTTAVTESQAAVQACEASSSGSLAAEATSSGAGVVGNSTAFSSKANSSVPSLGGDESGEERTVLFSDEDWDQPELTGREQSELASLLRHSSLPHHRFSQIDSFLDDDLLDDPMLHKSVRR
ncbi:hypothetical protein BJ742DRAFT_788496 [Cladochytrium replicatum]|nr:hypothetical protein BJ742DRAFT_788496 [Cladochytrium replicatum]